MTLLSELKKAVEGSILQVHYSDHEIGGQKKGEITEYYFRFSIPTDKCVDAIRFSISPGFIKLLKSIGAKFGLEMKKKDGFFIFFSIANAQ